MNTLHMPKVDCNFRLFSGLCKASLTAVVSFNHHENCVDNHIAKVVNCIAVRLLLLLLDVIHLLLSTSNTSCMCPQKNF